MALIAHWPLTGDLLDISGNDNTATNIGAVVNTEGKIGSCYIFNTAYAVAHTNTAVYMNTGLTTDINKSYTLMGWASQTTSGVIIGYNPPLYNGLAVYLSGTTAIASVNNNPTVQAQATGLVNQ